MPPIKNAKFIVLNENLVIRNGAMAVEKSHDYRDLVGILPVDAITKS